MREVGDALPVVGGVQDHFQIPCGSAGDPDRLLEWGHGVLAAEMDVHAVGRADAIVRLVGARFRKQATVAHNAFAVVAVD